MAKKTLERTIIDVYGMSLNMVSLLKALGLKDRRQAKLWLKNEDIQAVEINGRDRWLATDVARALENSKFRTL
ncbi:MAG: hypothetical protein J6J18_03695 [Oscillospiraceae bacterium]|nr:hypothetical protein [Clostridia bacterium]MBP3672914.1 hypothetical protein [Oscillospiraceae bacterium]